MMTEATVICYLNYLVCKGKSYSVVNTHKSMLLQTLKLSNNTWCDNACVIVRFMKGLFNKLLPKPRYTNFIWDVSVMLSYLKSLFPLDKLSLKLLTFKPTALIALASAPRAQTIIPLNLDCMTVLNSKIQFRFNNLLKTSKPGKNNYILSLPHYEDEKICVMHILLYYVDRTKSLRDSQQLLISYCSFKPVTSSTVARWLKEMLKNSVSKSV